MADLKKSIKDEMNSTPGCIPAKWNRFTVADGDWMQAKTLDQLMNRDDFLADKIGEGNYVWKDALSSESATRYSYDQYLSASISSLSGEFYTFSADDYLPTVTSLSSLLNYEISRATQAENNLSGRISIEETARSAADAKLQKQIDELQAATDVIAVFGTYPEFTAATAATAASAWKEQVTDNDFIKVLRDSAYKPTGDEDANTSDDDYYQVYYQWHSSDHDGWNGWSAIGSLDPYYSVSEIDEYKKQIDSNFDSLSSTVADNFLSANENAVSAGKNILIDYEQNKPKITIKTKEDVEFNNVSSKTVSSTNVTALTAQGNSAKFTNISSNNISATNLNNIDISNLFNSAYSGATASAYITAYSADFLNSAHSAYGTLTFGTKAYPATSSNYNFTFNAGQEINFTTGENKVTIGVTNNLITSANAGSAASAWVSSHSAGLNIQGGYGISTGTNENGNLVINIRNNGCDYAEYGLALGGNSSAIGALGGPNAFAFGDYCYAHGANAFAAGCHSTAGKFAVAMGWNNVATGDYSLALGYNSTAERAYTVAIGRGLSGEAPITLGTWNDNVAGATFIIGDGTGTQEGHDVVRKNALVIKDGLVSGRDFSAGNVSLSSLTNMSAFGNGITNTATFNLSAVKLSAGQGIGFKNDTNGVLSITAEGTTYQAGNYISTSNKTIAVTGDLITSANAGSAASAWINSKNSTIAFTTNFKGSNNVITGYGTSSFSAGESNIYVRKDELECEIGTDNSATNHSFAQGSANRSNNVSLAQGDSNSAYSKSFAQGKSNSANENSFVQGISNTAYDDSFAQGYRNSANSRAFAQGGSNTAYYESFAQGQINRVSNYSIGQGQGNSATNCSIAQGLHNNASNTAQAFGDNLVIESAMAIGKFNKTSSDAVFVIGNGTADSARNDLMVVDNSAAITLINYNNYSNQVDKIIISTTGVSGMYDHTHGGFVSTGEYSSEWSNICNIENKYVPLSALKCDIGSNNSASNDELVFMQGMSNYAYGNSLTQGSDNSAINNSLAQGYRNLASSNSIAVGMNNSAYANSQSFGQESYASAGGIAINPHYWGSASPTKAINNSFAMGKECVANNDSLAFGQNNTASYWSVAFGLGISANNNQYIYGIYPIVGSNTVFAIGNGTADNARSNYVSINKYGTLNLKNTVNNTNKSVIINGHDRYIRSEENCRNIPFLLTSGYSLTTTITGSLLSTPEINTETLLLYGNDSDYLNMWVPTGTSGNKFKLMKVTSLGTYKISVGIQAGYDMIFKNFSSGTTLASRKKIQTDNTKTSWPIPQQGKNISTSAKSFYFPAEANTTCVQFTEIPGHDDIDVIVDSLGKHFIMIKNHSEV